MLCSLISMRSCTEPTRNTTEDLRRVELQQGSKAPFSGILLTTAALAKLVTILEKQIKTLKLELAARDEMHAAKLAAKIEICNAKLEAESAKRSAAMQALQQQKSIYEKALTKSSASPPWYKSRYLSFIIGAALSGGVCAAASAR